MLAYKLIEIAERLNMITRKLVGPFICSKNLPDHFKDDARMLIARAEILVEQIADSPDLDTLYDGLQDFRTEVDGFIKALSTPR